jgi:hypothetical protein
MTRGVVSLAFFGWTLAAAVPAHAKVPLERMSIWGGDLAEPIAITDAVTLRLSNPWHGSIAHWNGPEAQSPTSDTPVYDLYFEARWRVPPLNTDLVRAIYYVRYAPGTDGSPGRVYLPGKGEFWYARNVQAIYRDGREGHWHTATQAWDARIREALAAPLLGEPPNIELQRTKPAQAMELRR